MYPLTFNTATTQTNTHTFSPTVVYTHAKRVYLFISSFFAYNRLQRDAWDCVVRTVAHEQQHYGDVIMKESPCVMPVDFIINCMVSIGRLQ